MNPSEKSGVDTNKVFLAEYGTLSLEFKYLSKHTGEPVYGQLIDSLYQMIRTMNTTDGLLPLIISFPFSVKLLHFTLIE